MLNSFYLNPKLFCHVPCSSNNWHVLIFPIFHFKHSRFKSSHGCNYQIIEEKKENETVRFSSKPKPIRAKSIYIISDHKKQPNYHILICETKVIPKFYFASPLLFFVPSLPSVNKSSSRCPKPIFNDSGPLKSKFLSLSLSSCCFFIELYSSLIGLWELSASYMILILGFLRFLSPLSLVLDITLIFSYCFDSWFLFFLKDPMLLLC